MAQATYQHTSPAPLLKQSFVCPRTLGPLVPGGIFQGLSLRNEACA